MRYYHNFGGEDSMGWIKRLEPTSCTVILITFCSRSSSTSGTALKAPRGHDNLPRWMSKMARLKLLASKKKLTPTLGRKCGHSCSPSSDLGASMKF